MIGWALTEQPAARGTYVLAGWLFLRLLGLIYLAAFASLAVQIRGLVGREGILPASALLGQRAQWSLRRYCRLPTLCWFSSSDACLLFLCWGGVALSLFLVFGFAPAVVLLLLWLFYLSLFVVSGTFLGYQWDILLLETGFLAIFLAPQEILPGFPSLTAPSPVILVLLWWLLFRLMFSSGAVKLRSGDLAWRSLTALAFHYETQPLPTRLAWHAHQMPLWFHKACALLMFTIELLVPFLIFAPPPFRRLAAGLFIILMVLIELTGNYCFFNLLGIALSVLLLDDAVLLPVFHRIFPAINFIVIPAPVWMNWLAAVLAIVIGVLSLEPLARLFRAEFRWPYPMLKFLEWMEPFHLVNSYGLFSVMTTERPEIIIEGSDDGEQWQAYEFKWKPGDVKRAPRFVAPHQPRLDWQMWFAALGYYPNHPWLRLFLERLLASSPPVLKLLRRNPFARTRPRFVRAVLYDYRFTNSAGRRTTGAWWQREERGAYSPIISDESAKSE